MGKKRRAWNVTGRTEIAARTRAGKTNRIWDQTARERKSIARYINYTYYYIVNILFKKNWIIVLEAQQRLIELEAEKQRLDDELTRAQKKISVSEKAVASLTIVEPVIYIYLFKLKKKWIVYLL